MGLKHCKEFSSTDDYERERYKSTEKVTTVIGYDDKKNIYFKRSIAYTVDSTGPFTVCKVHIRIPIIAVSDWKYQDYFINDMG
ncbi:apoptosis-inducing factor 3 isoform X1 [Vespula maculifrons]|uniref:Apoptosis-inducing factor 3 isoform X1 n=1 Tax=Vespula maculifrons TaxID=7453 RepID=A0ABD2CSH8_VESMC